MVSNPRNYLRYQIRALTREPARYRKLLRTLYASRSKVIVEIGTHQGKNAVQMIQTASVRNHLNTIRYYGFDLFEDLTEAQLASEFSLKPHDQSTVADRISATGVQFELFKGDTRTTLPNFLDQQRGGREIDFVFIDGGHSFDAIASDWGTVEKLMTRDTIVIFDDYYTNPQHEVPGLGCQHLLSNLDRRKYAVEVFRQEDRFQHDWGVLGVRMASVRRR